MPPQTSERPLIIERPDLQTAGQRFGYLSLTFICWFLWLYLFVPLLSLMAWVLGASTVYDVMLQNLSLDELLQILKVYGTGVGLLTAIYLIWATTSYLRFRNVERRMASEPVSEAEIAASHHVPLGQLQMLKKARRAVIPAGSLEQMFGSVEVVEENDGQPGEPSVESRAA